MNDIRDYSLEELEELFKNWQEPPYHARQVFSWIYQKGIYSFDMMSNLSLEARKKLKENLCFKNPKLVELRESLDGTKKFLFGLEDGNLIESVMIPQKGRNSVCLSTQAGCKYGCRFCASGLLGFKRNLSAWEIIAQLIEINRSMRPHPGGEGKVTHIVFMGTGEPLDNYDNVLKAIRITNAKDGLSIGARRITISTAGVIPGIERLAKEGMQVELSVSLHGADDKTRSALMPINRKYPLKDLIPACKKYALSTRRQVTFEYVLIKDVNCSVRDAGNLAKLLRGWIAKVNLLIYNPIKELVFKAPCDEEISAFKQMLQKEGIAVTSRKPRGRDIEGACGQLRLR